MRTLRITSSVGPYNSGEVITLDDHLAAVYVARGYAVEIAPAETKAPIVPPANKAILSPVRRK